MLTSIDVKFILDIVSLSASLGDINILQIADVPRVVFLLSCPF